MQKTIALTGVTGAMGGEVLKSLMQSSENFKVRCIIYEKEKSVAKFVKNTIRKYGERIYAFRGDIARYEDCVRLLDGADYLIHCAAIIPPKSDHDPDLTYRSNYIGTKNLVDTVIAAGNNIAFVHISTVALYGNRSYPHVWGRVGDPVISSDYDYYSAYKLKAERYVLESGLKKFVSLRQTAVLHKYMFANNMKDGLMYHTAFNCPLEWVTDADSGVLCKNLVEYDMSGDLDGFWNDIHNIGGGASCRVTGIETLDAGFGLMGSSIYELFEPNWNVARNFHGVWFYDSDELENKLHFRSQSHSGYWAQMAEKYRYFKLAEIVPKSLIIKFVFKRLFKNTNAPMYWINHNKVGRIKAFYGGKAEFEKIGTDWSKFPLLCKGRTKDGDIDYDELKDINNAKRLLLDHGYDETKPLSELTYADLCEAAAFRGGKCLTEDYKAGDVCRKVEWQCHDGHIFSSSPLTVLRGGYWCPHCCEPPKWRYGALAKAIPFYAQVYFDTHGQDETDDVYPLSDDEDDFIKVK